MTAAAFASVMLLAVRRWALVATWLLFLVLGNTSSGGAISPPLLPRPFALIFHAFQHARLVAVSAARTRSGSLREADQGADAPTVLTTAVSLRTPITNKNEPDRTGTTRPLASCRIDLRFVTAPPSRAHRKRRAR
jgi:hypothetical protein